MVNSSKPSGGAPSAKAQDQKREESRRYVESQKATTQPKSTATVNGQSVKVDASSQQVSDLRGRSSTYIAPSTRRNRIETHVVHHYNHPYDYYYSRPVSYGIGPYSNAFWWMMSEWSAERRAQWLYNHQSELSAQAYADAVRDQEVQRRIAALEAQKVARNASYVDPEFASDPSDVYDQAYVEAAYNPTIAPEPSPVVVSAPYNGPSALKVLFVFLAVAVVAGVVYAALTIKIGE